MVEWMDNIEMAIQKVCASKVYTSAEFKREKDNFQVSTNLPLDRIILMGQSHVVDIYLSPKYPHCQSKIPKIRNNYSQELRGFSPNFHIQRFIYFHNRAAYSAAGKCVDRSWQYTYKCPQTHEFGNWD
jgi:hypothetical protein